MLSNETRVAQLVLAHHAFVKALAFKLAPWPGLVDDITQQVFLEFLAKQEKWDLEQDLRPLLANLPGLAPAAGAGRTLRAKAKVLRDGGAENLTLAASYLMQAARLLSRAGYEQEAELAEGDAFVCIQDAVHDGAGDPMDLTLSPWQFESVHVSAPPRIDLGGGWSDTPPFCFDWGGTVPRP